MVKLMFVNNLGGGYADYVEMPDNTTVEKFFAQKMSGCDAQDYLIRVNRLPVPRDYILKDGDRITITPTKVEGAAIRARTAGVSARVAVLRPRLRGVWTRSARLAASGL